MATLYCDPSFNNIVRLQYKDRVAEYTNPRSEEMLQRITELTQGETIDRLVLVNQAESFTLIRMLATVFNTLAFSTETPLYMLELPVEDLTTLETELDSHLGELVDQIVPVYSKAPNIS